MNNSCRHASKYLFAYLRQKAIKVISRQTVLLSCILVMVLASLRGQEARTENFWGFGFNYGLDFPAADMADRFGSNFHAGVAVELFRTRWKGLLRFEAMLLFGENVNEDVISVYRLENNAILGNDGSYADVFLRQRGAYIGLMAKKILVPSRENPNAGLALGLGLGYLQHNIRFQVDSNNAPQFEGDYAKGYDRNTGGPALKQAISYLHIGRNRNVNYEISLVVSEAFTSNRRGYNFDTGMPDNASRLDMMIGLDLKWIIPVKDQQAAGEIYY